MKDHKHLPILTAAAVAVAILLSLILWLRPSPSRGPGPDPAAEGGEAVRHRFGPPDEWCAAGAKSKTYGGALRGDGFRADATTAAFLGQSPPDGPYLPDYKIGRAYLGWDTTALPDGAEVLFATLVLDLPVGGGRENAFDIVVYRSGRTPPLVREDWQSPGGQAVGRWHLAAARIEEQEPVRSGQGVALYPPEAAQTVRLALDPAVVTVGGITRLALRHGGEGVPPVTAEGVSLGPSQIRLEVEYRP